MCNYFSEFSQSCSQRKPKGYVIMVFSKWSFGGCQYGTIMFRKWPTKDPANNGGEKVNIEYNVTGCTTLLKQQNKDWVSSKQKIGHAALAGTRDHVRHCTTDECEDTLRAHAQPTLYVSAKAITNLMVVLLSFVSLLSQHFMSSAQAHATSCEFFDAG